MTLDQLLSKAFNGKAENIVISKNIIMFHLDGVETRINLVSFIDQIFNDHETAIEILMKANEEEISRHFNECEKYEAQLKEVKFAITVLNKNLELNSELLKAKDEEIERLKEIIDTSIEEIEYAIIRPQYVEVYLNNAIRFLKDDNDTKRKN